MPEFSIIKNYFTTQTEHRKDVIRGIGDDAAIVKIPSGEELVITTDTLVSGIHFLPSDAPYDIGYKSLAVNLSDLAAMGATPAWITLALTLPTADENWIQNFCAGFFTLANLHQVQLIGGDLTHGPLSITVQAMGLVPAGNALLRSTAKPGDLIYVTGTLGNAGLALQHLQGNVTLHPDYEKSIYLHLHRPEPRIAAGLALRGIAHAAIDLSDGLAADLSHVLEESHVGARVNVDQLPLSFELSESISHEKAIELALTAGDDYELCFTVPPDKQTLLENQLSVLPCRFTCIGTITNKPGLDLHYQDGKKYHGVISGYEHF